MSEIIKADNIEVFDPEKAPWEDCETGFIAYEIPDCNIDIEYGVEQSPYQKIQSITATFTTAGDISAIDNKFDQRKPSSALLVIRNN